MCVCSKQLEYPWLSKTKSEERESKMNNYDDDLLQFRTKVMWKLNKVQIKNHLVTDTQNFAALNSVDWVCI